MDPWVCQRKFGRCDRNWVGCEGGGSMSNVILRRGCNSDGKGWELEGGVLLFVGYLLIDIQTCWMLFMGYREISL